MGVNQKFLSCAAVGYSVQRGEKMARLEGYQLEI